MLQRPRAPLPKRSGAELDDGAYVSPGRELGGKARAHFFQQLLRCGGCRENVAHNAVWISGGIGDLDDKWEGEGGGVKPSASSNRVLLRGEHALAE